MRRLYNGLLLSAFVATAANASFTDDMEVHATFVGGKRYDHTAKPAGQIPEGTHIYFSSLKPADKQLIVRPKGNLMEYTCPAVAGVLGLEKPRPMGLCPVYLVGDNGTQVQVLKASYDDMDERPLTGLYQSLGIVPLTSVVENGSRVNRLRMICRSGVADGMPVTIDYKETYPELVSICDMSQAAHPGSGLIHADNTPNASTPACLTFCCWYKSKGATAHLDLKTLLELRIAAVEDTLKGQTKKLSLVVSNAADKPQLYVALQGSKDVARQVKVKTGTKQVEVVKAIPEKFTMVNVPTGKFQEKRSNRLAYLDKNQKKEYFKHNKLDGFVLVGDNKTGSFFHVDRVPITKQVKNVTQKAVAAVFKTEDVFEERTLHELKENALVDWWVPKDGWMNFVMHVDAATKLATVFCNGQQVLCGATNFEYSLNTPFAWTLAQKHAADISDVHLIQGQLVPASSFCARNSQNEVVPVKFVGNHGPRGYQRWN